MFFFALGGGYVCVYLILLEGRVHWKCIYAVSVLGLKAAPPTHTRTIHREQSLCWVYLPHGDTCAERPARCIPSVFPSPPRWTCTPVCRVWASSVAGIGSISDAGERAGSLPREWSVEKERSFLSVPCGWHEIATEALFCVISCRLVWQCWKGGNLQEI